MATFINKVTYVDESGAAVVTAVCPSSLTVAVGDAVEVFVKYECATGAAGVTVAMASGSNGGNTFVQEASRIHSTQTDLGGVLFRSIITAAGTFAPTVGFSGGTANYVNIGVVQWRPAGGFVLQADNFNSADSGATAATTGSAGSTAVTSPGTDFMGLMGYNLLNFTPDTGFTLVNGGANHTADSQYATRAAGATANPVMTWDISSVWLALYASLKEVSPGGSTPLMGQICL